MTIDGRCEGGFEARLTPRGLTRLFTAAFLSVWLCGWAIGEFFALAVLVRGSLALVTGQRLGSGHAAMSVAVALGIGGFLLVWLALWTPGGAMAALELLRSLWAEDRLAVVEDGLAIEHRIGPFRSRRTIARTDVREVRILRRGAVVVAETGRSRVELSRLGTTAERMSLAADLGRVLRLGEAGRGPAGPELPEGWEEVVTPEGLTALVQDTHTRTSQARVAAILTFVFSAATMLVVRQTLSNPAALGGAVAITALTLLLAWGTVWLARGRMEWRIESGRLVLQRRFGSALAERFHADRLQLSMRTDSDGDEWFTLEAVAPAAPERPRVPSSRLGSRGGGRRRRIHRAINDDSTTRRLGLWLARRAQVPFDDGTHSRSVTA